MQSVENQIKIFKLKFFYYFILSPIAETDSKINVNFLFTKALIAIKVFKSRFMCLSVISHLNVYNKKKGFFDGVSILVSE